MAVGKTTRTSKTAKPVKAARTVKAVKAVKAIKAVKPAKADKADKARPVRHIVKRKGHSEPYDVRKLYASIFSSCLSVRTPVGTAELVAEEVCRDVGAWLEQKHEVTSIDIRRIAADHLQAYNPEAAYVYGHHRDFI